MPPGLLVQTDADFADARVYPEPYAELGRMQIGGVAFYLVRHDASLIGELVDDGHEPPPLLAYLDEYAPADSPHRLACDLWYLQQIHFGHERDDKRRRAIVERVLRARPELRGYRDFALGEPGPEHPAWQSVARLGFDVRDAAASRSGSAFAGSPSARERSGQSPAAGAVGAYLNSYTEADAGYAAGSYLSAPFVVEGAVTTLRVGGGFRPETLTVELIVDGETQHRATGCDTDVLGARVWITEPLRGAHARLRVVDRARDAGHVVRDGLGQPVRLWYARPGARRPALW
jgi:hypothetical protein